MNPWLEVLASSVREGALISVIDIPVAFLVSYLFAASVFDALGLILLLESVALMLTGGAMEIGGTASATRLYTLMRRKKFEWSSGEYKKAQTRGAFYSLVGVMFFLESLALAAATTL